VSVSDVFADVPGTYAVPVTLAEPVNHTVAWTYLTINRTVLYEGNHFPRTFGYVVFHPGETVKHITVRILKPISTGNYFGVYLEGFPGHPLELLGKPLTKSEGKIGNVPAWPRQDTLPPPTNKAISVTKPTTLAYEELFKPGFVANDAGKLADGSPCWRSRPGHGRTQPNNKEIGYYADSILNPGTMPFGWDEAGQFFIQAEYVPAGVKDQAGVTMQYTYGGGAAENFVYTAGMITSEFAYNKISVGSYVEAHCKLPAAKGSWPAFWLVPVDWWTWPSMEVDVFEGFFGSGFAPTKVGTTVHWKGENNRHEMYGLNSRVIKAALPSYDPRNFHTYGVHCGERAFTFTIDGIPYMQVPNTFPKKQCFVLLNVAIQGNAPDPAQYPARMGVEFLRVWL
jgi:hypothetical protein